MRAALAEQRYQGKPVLLFHSVLSLVQHQGRDLDDEVRQAGHHHDVGQCGYAAQGDCTAAAER